MFTRTFALAAASASLLVSSALAATTTVDWVEIANNYPNDSVPDYSSAVLAADSTFTTRQARTFDLVLNVSSDIRWASAELQLNALPQTIHYLTGADPRNPKAESWGSQPALEFSTFLCVPIFGRIGGGMVGDPPTGGSLLGKAQYPAESGVGTAIVSTSAIDAAWGDTTVTNNFGVFTVARVTLLDSWGGGNTFAGRVGIANNVIAPVPFSFTSGSIPEPAIAGGTLLAAFMAMRRRHPIAAS